MSMDQIALLDLLIRERKNERENNVARDETKSPLTYS